MAYEPVSGTTTTSIRWKQHHLSQNTECFCCGTQMRALKFGERHHCRSCGNVICTACSTNAVLNERIEEGGLERLKSDQIIILSTVCKICKIRGLISDNATSKGLTNHPTLKSTLKSFGPATITTTNNSRGGISKEQEQLLQNKLKHNNNRNNLRHKSRRNSLPSHYNNAVNNTQVKCFSCFLGVPPELVSTFEWQDLLKPTNKSPDLFDGNHALNEALFCHRCAFGNNDRRGGLRSLSVLVSRLSPNVIAEDLHATLEDHFGGVERVHIPRGTDGKPKTDSEGYAFAQVFFYKTPLFQRADDSNVSNRGEITRWQKRGGLESCLHTGWCWNGMSKGQRCRIHHGTEMNSTNALKKSKKIPIGPLAVRSNIDLSSKVRHVKGQHGSFNESANKARDRLSTITLNQQLKVLSQSNREIFKFNDTIQSAEEGGAGPYKLAKIACQHNDVSSMKRLLTLNQRAISSDTKSRRQLFDPYALGPSGRSCIHIACKHSSFAILHLLLSDKMQAMQMAIRAQQQRVLVAKESTTKDDEDIFLKVVNQVDISGHTPLHLVCENQNIDLRGVKLLLDRGSDPNLRTSRGETALYFAARNGNALVCSELAPVTEVSEVITVINSGGDLLGEVQRILKSRVN